MHVTDKAVEAAKDEFEYLLDRKVSDQLVRRVLTAALPHMGGARVKPLAWRDSRATHEAYTLFGGAYIITAYAGMAEPFKLEERGFDGSFSTYYRHLDEAKAAAQADYERRILSALASHEPAPTDTQEGWYYSINYGPDGEADWANLSTPKGEHVANIRVHHARAIVAGMDALTACQQEVWRYKEMYAQKANEKVHQFRRAEATEARNAELVKALRFYADVSKYPAPLTGGMGALWSDCGECARAALGGQSNEA